MDVYMHVYVKILFSSTHYLCSKGLFYDILLFFSGIEKKDRKETIIIQRFFFFYISWPLPNSFPLSLTVLTRDSKIVSANYLWGRNFAVIYHQLMLWFHAPELKPTGLPSAPWNLLGHFPSFPVVVENISRTVASSIGACAGRYAGTSSSIVWCSFLR